MKYVRRPCAAEFAVTQICARRCHSALQSAGESTLM